MTSPIHTCKAGTVDCGRAHNFGVQDSALNAEVLAEPETCLRPNAPDGLVPLSRGTGGQRKCGRGSRTEAHISVTDRRTLNLREYQLHHVLPSSRGKAGRGKKEKQTNQPGLFDLFWPEALTLF